MRRRSREREREGEGEESRNASVGCCVSCAAEQGTACRVQLEHLTHLRNLKELLTILNARDER